MLGKLLNTLEELEVSGLELLAIDVGIRILAVCPINGQYKTNL